MSSSAPSDVGRAAAVESVRAVARVRRRLRTMSTPSQVIVVVLGSTTLVVAGMLLTAVERVTWGDGLTAAALALAYGLATRVRFESAAVNTVPTEPILVAALLLIPVELVPLVTIVGLLLVERLEPGESRLLKLLHVAASNLVVLGPVVVLHVADLDSVSFAHWPVYLAALASQFLVDFVCSFAYCFVLGVSPRELPVKLSWTYTLDALLAPIGVMAVISADGAPWAIVLASLPVGVLALLARDRLENLEQAVAISGAYEQAMDTARRDELTELGNRRAWSEALADAERVVAASRASTPVTVILGDVDGLKSMNDRLGHDAGDLLICEAAAAVRSGAPDEAFVARLGGDEFGILVVGRQVDEEQALERLRAAVAAAPQVHGTSLSISFGAASCPEIATIDEALAVADARVYDDKRARGGHRR